jgi:Ni/Co efflux regulator RcnB
MFHPLEFTMTIRKSIAALVAAALFTGQFALAQGDLNLPSQPRNEQRQRYDQTQRYDPSQRYEQSQRYDQQGRRDRNDARQGYRQNQIRGYGNDQRYERGAGPNRNFHRGARLPYEYRTRQYVVEDWRGHRLSAPPRGYHWVQSGSDYLLVAITTGIILQMLLNN